MADEQGPVTRLRLRATALTTVPPDADLPAWTIVPTSLINDLRDALADCANLTEWQEPDWGDPWFFKWVCEETEWRLRQP